MHAHGILKPASEIWKLTWTRMDEVVPSLREDIFGADDIPNVPTPPPGPSSPKKDSVKELKEPVDKAEEPMSIV